MKFNRMISVNGVSVIDGVNVNINFNYTSEEIPSTLSFSFVTSLGANVNGSASIEKITSYSVSDGIVTDELLKLVESECTRVLTNYDTV